jgi:hypothetical protein
MKKHNWILLIAFAAGKMGHGTREIGDLVAAAV